MLSLESFLRKVITTPTTNGIEGSTAPAPMYFCLALRDIATGVWYEEFYEWPMQIEHVIERARAAAEAADVYFSSYLFSERSSARVNVLPSYTLQADLDAADIPMLPVQPSILVQSSPGRHQAYWLLRQDVPVLDTDLHEVLSRKLTYSIPACDRSGWPLGRKLRLPETFNHKYLEGSHPVYVTSAPLKEYDTNEIELLPEPNKIAVDSFDETWLNNPPTEANIGPQQIFNDLKEFLPAKVVTQYNKEQPDRSAALWSLMCALFRAGVPRDMVFYLAYHSANNKFLSLKYHGNRELAKDVLRAEQVARISSDDIRALILQARKLPGSAIDKHQQLLGIVLKHLQTTGQIMRTTDDTTWYIRNDLGRPIAFSPRSDYLRMILDLQFGLNPTELDQSYVVQGLCNYGMSMPVNAETGSLSHYSKQDNSLLLHSGKSVVYRITTTDIERTTDGSYGVVFPWVVSTDPFIVDLTNPITPNWAESLFDGCLDNVVNTTPEYALCLLRTWLLFLLFRNISVSRPILALFGQPGAGKSTLFRRIYALLYGKRRSIGSVTTPEDYDHAVSSDPFVALDNVDTWERWLPDRLALAASTSDITKRKLWTDADVVILKRQAVLGISAHNPRFGREDVADRLLLLTFERLPHFGSEEEIIQRIILDRPRLWGGIAKDVQRIISTPMPPQSEAPQFRVADFAHLGYWIATALGYADEFHAALSSTRKSQKSFSLEEDNILIATLHKYISTMQVSAVAASTKGSASATNGHKAKTMGTFEDWKTVNQLWKELELCSPDMQAFNRTYKNAMVLGRKLWSLHDALKEVFDVQYKADVERGARLWNIKPK